MAYDSVQDYLAHKENVTKVMDIITSELQARAKIHDDSKAEEPERSCYDKYIPMLKTAKYGSKEYNEIRKKMFEEGLSHHYFVNRHHPEHFANGMNDFTIVDLVEFWVDTYAASLRSDTPYEEGVITNAKRYGIPDMLLKILQNTAREYGI